MYGGFHNYRSYFGEKPSRETLRVLHELRTHPKAHQVVAAAMAEEVYYSHVDGYRLKHTAGAICPLRLVGRHCRREKCSCRALELEDVFKMRELYIRDRRPVVFISHPRFLEAGDLKKLADFCGEYALTYTIKPTSWVSYGLRLRLEIVRGR